MKLIGLILALILNFNVIGSYALANQCSDIFNAQDSVKLNLPKKDGGEVLLDVFSLIVNAPNNSKVRIFTENIKNDGIGALLLMLSVAESSKARGLSFEFNLSNAASISRIHDLYAERSSNRMRFRDMMAEPQEKVTRVIVESKDQKVVYEFNGELTSSSLKDASMKGPIPVSYAGKNMLRASPFHFVDGISVTTLSGGAPIAVKNQDSYVIQHRSKTNMTEADIININDKAFDLALQLYVQKKGHSPKEEMDVLQILRAAVN